MSEPDHLRHLQQLAGEAAAADSDGQRTALLAQLQRVSAWALRDAVARVRDSGVSWRELAAGLSVATTTLYGQYRAGRGVIVAGDSAMQPPRQASNGGRRQAAHRSDPAREDLVNQSSEFPPSGNRFVGRETDLADLRALLRRSHLVTLTGPAGVGKTRLTMEFIHQYSRSYQGGVWWVDLAARSQLSDSAVLDATTAAVAARGQPERSIIEIIADAGRSGPSLLVLDDCEHLVDQCSELADTLLAACPRLHILATSREELHSVSESLFPLSPLPVHDYENKDATDRRQVAAVQLFADRARSLTPDFEFTQESAEVIAQICRKLDGLPLAIELAASRIRILTVHEILSLLEDRFTLLDTASGPGPYRRRSLRAAIEWSYVLLTPDEQTVLRRLAVLSGGFSVAVATAACADGTSVKADMMLDILTGLESKSLVHPVRSERGTRFRQLESVRLHALDKLAELDAVGDCQTRVIDWFYTFVDTHLCSEAPGLRDPWSQVSTELEGLQAAARWAEQAGDTRHVGLTSTVARLWLKRGQVDDAGELLARALEKGTATPRDRAYGLNSLAFIELRRADHREAARLGLSALELARAANDSVVLFEALEILGRAHLNLNQLETSGGYLRESISVSTRMQFPHWQARAKTNLAEFLMVSSKLDEASATLLLAEPAAHGEADTTRLLRFWHVRGAIALRRGAIDDAETAFKELVSNYSINVEHAIDPAHLANGLEGLAIVAMRRGDPERALRLAAAAAAQRGTGKEPSETHWRSTVTSMIGPSQDVTVSPGAAWVEGHQWAEPDATSYALDQDESQRAVSSLLTPRERQVVELISSGFTNLQAAARLHISPRTIANHLHNIRKKLGVDSRAEMIVWFTSDQEHASRPPRKNTTAPTGRERHETDSPPLTSQVRAARG